jgi:hypothetical protein
VESNPRRTADPYDEELDSAGNLDNLHTMVNPRPQRVAHGAERERAKRTREANGGWRQGGRKVMCVKKGAPCGGHESCMEVRAAIVAMKRL